MKKEGKPASPFFADKLGPLPKGGLEVRQSVLHSQKINDETLGGIHTSDSVEVLLQSFSPVEHAEYLIVLPKARDLMRRLIDAMQEPITDVRLDFPNTVPAVVIRAVSAQVLKEYSFELLAKNQFLEAAKKNAKPGADKRIKPSKKLN